MNSFAVAAWGALGGDADTARQHHGAVVEERQFQKAAAVGDLRIRRCSADEEPGQVLTGRIFSNCVPEDVSGLPNGSSVFRLVSHASGRASVKACDTVKPKAPCDVTAW